MPETILIFYIDGLFLTTKDIFSDIESFSWDIGRSFYEFESLPANLWLLIVLARREVKEGRELLTIHDRCSLPPGELPEDIVTDEKRERFSFYGLEFIVRGRSELGKC